MNILDFQKKKIQQEKISMITCYDFTSARIISKTLIDCILVGDSVAMTMHGFKDTLAANLPMICLHTAAVSRGLQNKFIISDMPFLSYRKSLTKNVSSAEALIKAGAHAVKLECAKGNTKLIKHLVESGIPVMGHIGLTPQLINMLGGYKIQGKTTESANQLKNEALQLQEAGCFAIVLECVPTQLAKEITHLLTIPTIGVGAGPFTDGQVLVFQDLLGLNIDFQPRFVKTFADGYTLLQQGIAAYVNAIQTGVFPSHEHCYND